jgi:membrane dipeptidase
VKSDEPHDAARREAIRRLLVLAPVLACGFGAATDVTTAITTDDISLRARKLHFSSLVIDTHADTTQRFLGGQFAADGSFHSDLEFDFAARDARGSVDIPRMREGGLGAIFFSIWIPSKIKGPLAVARALEQIAAVHDQVRRHPADLAFATTASEIRAAHAQGKIAALIGIEGGHMINSDLGVLRHFAALGARYMTLTHTGNVEWADSSGATPVHHGLTPFGREVIHEMNRLGMMVDISHVSDKTFYDVLAISEAPLLASHSSCRAICDAPRNMSDDMIKALAAKGGVIQINYHVAFLSQEFRDAENKDPQINKAIEAEVLKLCGDNEACELIEGDRFTRESVRQGKLPRVDWSKIVEHIDHAVQLVGAEHVGLGSDFDGANMPYGMEDVTQIPKITEALLRKGYSEDDVKKILGENTLRVMAEVERIGHAQTAAPQ